MVGEFRVLRGKYFFTLQFKFWKVKIVFITKFPFTKIQPMPQARKSLFNNVQIFFVFSR